MRLFVVSQVIGVLWTRQTSPPNIEQLSIFDIRHRHQRAASAAELRLCDGVVAYSSESAIKNKKVSRRPEPELGLRCAALGRHVVARMADASRGARIRWSSCIMRGTALHGRTRLIIIRLKCFTTIIPGSVREASSPANPQPDGNDAILSVCNGGSRKKKPGGT